MANLVGLSKDLTMENAEVTEKDILKISVVRGSLAHPFSHPLAGLESEILWEFQWVSLLISLLASPSVFLLVLLFAPPVYWWEEL